MPHLELTLFGAPQISLNGSPLTNRIDKTVALIALLAIQGPTLSRDMLITTLWSRSSISKAQAALRTAIWRLKDAGLSPWLEIEREFITLNKHSDLWVDVDEFQMNLDKAKQPPHDQTSACPQCTQWLRRAIELYRGDFMAGYSPRNAPGFDEWRTPLGQRLQDDYLIALARLAKGYQKQGLYGDAVLVANRWLAVDPLNEEAHTLIMRSYVNNNQRANAIAHYRAFKRLADKQLGVDPSREMTQLYQQVLTGHSPPPQSTAPLKEPALMLMDLRHIPDLWARHGAIMEKVVDRFTNVVKDGLLKCGGRLIKHTGDSFLIYFDHGQPLMCAVAILRMVAQTKWGLPDPLAVRIAITTVSKNRSHYPEYSPELVSCRALLYAAAGNQILLTEQAVRSLDFPISSRTNNLGSYVLPGQSNPTQVYELVHPHLLPHEPNELRNLVRSPANLPVQTTRFVGRETELEQLGDMLARAECRLVSLVGPGGVGKTRLGVQVISQLQLHQYDGTIYVPLAAHQNPETIYRPIAEALNLVFNNPGDQATQLIEHLRPKRMLLLLDNFEHLLAGTAYLVELLEGAPGLRIMLTSRERLNLRMEHPFEVRGLPYPAQADDPDFDQYSAVQLFVQNAQRVSPSFTLRAEDKAYIIQICKQVDGLPLGIELSSAWVRALSCQDIAASIKKNLDFLETRSHDVPVRHRSLRAAFEHSWKLLSEEDRRIIARLSVFSHNFSHPAAEQLANATPALLASFVDKNLLTRQSNGRYLMPDTLRVFVLEYLKSETQEYENLLDRHSEYFLQLLTNVFSEFARDSGASVIRELWLDADNIRVALNRALDRQNWPLLMNSIDPLLSVFEMQGRFREGYDYTAAMMQQVTEMVGMQQPDIYYNLSGWNGTFGFRLGFTQEALKKMQERFEYAQRQGDWPHAANTLMWMADYHRRLGETNKAHQEIQQSLQILEPMSAIGNPLGSGFLANALCILGGIQIRLNQVEAARQSVERCNAILQRSPARYVMIRFLEIQAQIANQDKRYEAALNHRQEALTIAEDFNDRRSVAVLLNNLSDSAEHLGDYASALAYLERASQISEDIGDRQISALLNNNLGFMTFMLDRLEESIQYYRKSLSLYREIGNKVGYFLTLRDNSRAYLKQGNILAAQARIVEALHLGMELNDPLQALQLIAVIAQLMMKTDRTQRAIPMCWVGLNHPQSNHDHRRNIQALLAELGVAAESDSSQAAPAPEASLPAFQDLLAEVESLLLVPA